MLHVARKRTSEPLDGSTADLLVLGGLADSKSQAKRIVDRTTVYRDPDGQWVILKMGNGLGMRRLVALVADGYVLPTAPRSVAEMCRDVSQFLAKTAQV